MFCKNCGTQLPDGTRFCTNCGADQSQNQQQQQYQQQSYQPPFEPVKIGFADAIRLYFKQYATFSGRARRSEFWWAWLFLVLVNVLCTILIGVSDAFSVVSTIWNLAVFIPTLAISVRRLHDVGHSGAFYLWILLPIAGPIILLVQFCKDSMTNNQYGPSPKGY